MEFAGWLAWSILSEVEVSGDSVTVRYAWMPPGAMASWSENSVFFISLAHDAIWSKPIGRDLIALVIHEAAHDQAFDHGSAFTNKVEKFVGACAVACLRAGRQALMDQFPTFESPIAHNPRASS